MLYVVAGIINVGCVLGGGAVVKFLLPGACRFNAFTWPVTHAVVCGLGGIAAFTDRLYCTEPLYGDTSLFDLLNPVAIYLGHAEFWQRLIAASPPLQLARTPLLSVLGGIIVGAAFWFLAGWVADKMSTNDGLT
jgi:hypothetical protein